jgi:benzoate-CoA ligase
MSMSAVEPPPEAFNFAAHLLSANAGRPGKTAFIDDAGALTYAELDERSRRFAAGLKSVGIRREERVLILMQDGADWPVAFLGAMLAGAVPVAVNTLLTADDLAYMLEHSRAQAAFVSGAVKPALKAALTKSDHEVHTVVVSRSVAPRDFGEIAFEDFLAGAAPLIKSARTHADDPAFWLYSSGSTGRPKGTVHSHANPYWTTELYGKAILGLKESDVCFSAAKLFFAYGLGNALTFPLAVGATALHMAERPTPEAVFKRWLGGVGGVKPTGFYSAPTGYAGILASNALP